MDYFKRNKSPDWSKFRLGMRTFKTGIGVLLCYLFLEYLGGEAFRSDLTAVGGPGVVRRVC